MAAPPSVAAFQRVVFPGGLRSARLELFCNTSCFLAMVCNSRVPSAYPLVCLKLYEAPQEDLPLSGDARRWKGKQHSCDRQVPFYSEVCKRWCICTRASAARCRKYELESSSR